MDIFKSEAHKILKEIERRYPDKKFRLKTHRDDTFIKIEEIKSPYQTRLIIQLKLYREDVLVSWYWTYTGDRYHYTVLSLTTPLVPQLTNLRKKANPHTKL